MTRRPAPLVDLGLSHLYFVGPWSGLTDEVMPALRGLGTGGSQKRAREAGLFAMALNRDGLAAVEGCMRVWMGPGNASACGNHKEMEA